VSEERHAPGVFRVQIRERVSSMVEDRWQHQVRSSGALEELLGALGEWG